jgi:glycosyltransferase involved in cell wall biosynthesis
VKKILYFHNGLSSFVKKDIEIIEKEFELLIFHFDVTNKKKVPLFFIKQLIFIVLNIFKSNTYVTQFGGYHSVLPCLIGKLFRKKSIIILGGTDCVSFPSIRYGNFYKKGLKIATTLSLKNASLLLPVDETLVNYKYNYQPNDYPFQGYKYFIKNIKTPYKVIYNGYDADKWRCSIQKEPNSFVTVGANLGSRFGFELKGIDLIFKIAPLFPACKFYIVGGHLIKNIKVPSNIILLDPIPNTKLADFISSKQFYLQLSMSEGFPNALCEAMLCECIPIVSAVGAMPKIVGDIGFVLGVKSEQELQKMIQLALKTVSTIDTKNVRERISTHFTLENRKEILNQTIKNQF